MAKSNSGWKRLYIDSAHIKPRTWVVRSTCQKNLVLYLTVRNTVVQTADLQEHTDFLMYFDLELVM